MSKLATLSSDPIVFIDPVTGPDAMQAAINRHLGEAGRHVSLERSFFASPGDEFLLSMEAEVGFSFSTLLGDLCQDVGPLLQDAVEIRMSYVYGDDGPYLRYAGPTEASVDALKQTRAIERAKDALSGIVDDQSHLDAMFAHLKPAAQTADAPLPSDAQRQAALKLAAQILAQADEKEVAQFVQRNLDAITVARPGGGPMPEGESPIYRHTITVTVLSEDRDPEFDSLKQIAREIDQGDCVGSWETVSIERLSGERALQAVKEVGSDESFFWPEGMGSDPDGDDDSRPAPRA